MAEIECEDCGAFISAPSDAVAGKFRCPHCRAVNLVPPGWTVAATRSASAGSRSGSTSSGIALADADDEPAPPTPHRRSSGYALAPPDDDDPDPPDDESDGPEPIYPVETDDHWADAPAYCAGCGSAMAPTHARCMRCGRPRDPLHPTPLREMRVDAIYELTGVSTLAASIGLVLAGTCALMWTMLVLLTGQPLGFAALGFAAAIGTAVPNLAERRGWRVSATCAGLVLLSLVLGKVLIVIVASAALAATDVTGQPHLMRAAVGREMIADRSFPAELQQAIDELAEADAEDGVTMLRSQMPGSLSVRVEQAVDDRLATMPEADRRAAAARLLADHPELAGLSARQRSAVSMWDAVWFAAALYIAWRLGAPTRRPRPRGIVYEQPAR